jgi:hypothetical protein
MKQLQSLVRLWHLCACLALLACLFPGQGWSQDKYSFEAHTDARQVLQNSYFEVHFTLSGANGDDFSPPAFDNFDVLAGPSTSSSVQIINGVVSREMSYAYTLRPRKAGRLTIGSASIRVKGKKLSTKPLSIEVVKPSGSGKDISAEEDVFVRLEISKTQSVVGEQLLLDFKLYTTVSVDGYDMVKEPDFQGFYAQEVRQVADRPVQEVVKGREYTTKLIRRIALFPQQTGTLEIEPAQLRLAVVEDGGRGGFFFNRKVRPVFQTTNSLKVKVTDLPSGAPESFTGAAGSYEFLASVNRGQVTTDEAFALRLSISGDGDMKRLQLPPLQLSDSFEVYAPRTVEDQLSDVGGKISGRRVLEYLVLPRFPGNFELSPAFSYYDTDKGRYQTVRTGPFRVKVLQGSGRSAAASSSANGGAAAVEGYRPLKTDTNLYKKGGAFYKSLAFWGLFAAPLLAFLGLLLHRIWQQRQAPDAAWLRSKGANKEALRRLALADKHRKEGNNRHFYDEVLKALSGYVCDKLSLPLSEFSKDSIREKLLSLPVSAALAEEYVRLVQSCEMALFAGLAPAGDMQGAYDRALKLIADIEDETTQK